MGSDKARRSYDAGRMYRSIVSQQGRVTVEADANEGEELRAAEARADLIDVIGPIGAPADGFKISVPAGSAPSDFAIGAGTLYVGGMRVVNANPGATYAGQSKIPEEWNGRPVEWVDFPVEAPTSRASELIFLTLAEQEVSAVEDPPLREPALGGPDTAARTRLIQRVKRCPVPPLGGCELGFAYTLKALYRSNAAFDSATMRLTSHARLRVDFVPTGGGADPCQPTAQAGFLGADNQLIRVQVSDRIGPDQTFLWGWDNGSTLYRVETTLQGPRVLHVTSIPFDQFHEPRQGQRVELLATAVKLDDDAYVASETGPVFEVESYEPGTRMLTLTKDVKLDFTAEPPPQLFIRIWENQLRFAADEATAVPLVYPDNKGIGLAIHAAADGWVRGDYWMIGVRPSTPDKILPARLTTLQPPDGPRRWLAPLAVINWAGETPTVSDCRPPFLDLVELTKRKGEPSGEGGCCELVVEPGGDIQAAIDALPDAGGAVCLKAGTHHITKQLHIIRSGVTLHGESGGTIVEMSIVLTDDTEPHTDFITYSMLDIRGGDEPLADVVVRDIAFVTTKVPAGPGVIQLLALGRCTSAQVRGCRFIAPPLTQPASGSVAISASGCRDLTIADNIALGITTGIDATDCLGQTDVLRNVITARIAVNPIIEVVVISRRTLGVNGIAVSGGDAELGRARIEHNRIENCAVGINVGGRLDHPTVEGNTILSGIRDGIDSDGFPNLFDPDQMKTYLGSRNYAISCLSSHAVIRNNHIHLRWQSAGGITSSGSETLVDGNVIESPETLKSCPAGIYCPAPEDGLRSGHRLYDNVLTGPQTGITVIAWNGVEVSRNRISCADRTVHGVRLYRVDSARVSDNEISRLSRKFENVGDGVRFASAAIYASDGRQNRFEGNRINGCMLGISTQDEANVVIVGNRIEGASLTAIGTAAFIQAASICDNRVLRCSYTEEADERTVAIDAHGEAAGSSLRIEGCEIVDLGTAPDGKPGPKRAVAILVKNVEGCQLLGNRVGYTDLKILEHSTARQPLVASGRLDPPGVALIANNDFVGSVYAPDLADPTEMGVVLVTNFKQVTFNNNICRERRQLEPGTTATVRLNCDHVIAIGNHVEAYDRLIPSITVDGLISNTVAFMGNSTTGDNPIISGNWKPQPNANFNVKV